MYIETSDQPRMKLGIGDYECNWGIHICGLYETEEERDGILLGFLNQGDLNGDLQLYSLFEQSEQDLKRKYTRCFPTCAGHTDDPHLFRFFPAEVLYYPDGVFSPWAMEDGLNAFFAESQANGPKNIRAAAEMAWALEAIPGVEDLMAYESRLNYFIPGKPWISICLYNIGKCSGAMVMQVLRTHPYTISGGIITQNPYYQDPDEWLAVNAPRFLKRTLCSDV